MVVSFVVARKSEVIGEKYTGNFKAFEAAIDLELNKEENKERIIAGQDVHVWLWLLDPRARAAELAQIKAEYGVLGWKIAEGNIKFNGMTLIFA